MLPMWFDLYFVISVLLGHQLVQPEMEVLMLVSDGNNEQVVDAVASTIDAEKGTVIFASIPISFLL